MTGTKRLLVLTVGLALSCTGAAMASQQRPDRVSDQQLEDLLDRLDTHGDAFRGSFERAIERSMVEGTPAVEEIRQSVKSLEQAMDLLSDRVDDRQSGTADAEDVLRRASFIDRFMMRHPLEPPVQGDWQAVRLDMDDLARAYGIAWNWSAASQDGPRRVDDKQVEQLLKQIGEKAGRFDKSLDRAFDRSGIDDRGGKNAIRRSVDDLRQTTNRLRDRVKGRQSNMLDAEEVLRRGAGIDGFMQRYQLNAQAEQGWLSLRGDLDRLARAYNVGWNWSDTRYAPAEAGGGFHDRLTGTYQLESQGSEEARRAAGLAVRGAPSGLGPRTYESLLARLEAPALIAIERSENTVTIASTRGRRLAIEADGRDRVERSSAGRSINTRASLQGERLVVVTTGDRESDFTVTFDPTEDGRSLGMTRTIDAEGLRQGVTVRSSYRRLSDDARWDIDASGPRDSYDNSGSAAGDAAVADGTRLVAVLDDTLSTSSAREGDLYTMTTRSPSRYEGAVIQGFVSAVNASGRPSGRAGMTLNLRSIRLRNGSSHQFDGVIEGIRTTGGETVRMDRDGTADGPGSQARKTAERSAIGAELGVIIGAIAGGGTGAAPGAVLGAGGGAGTVFVDGREQLELQRGTELTITAGDPRNLETLSGARR